MLDPIVSGTVFGIELLILYTFYSRMNESKYSAGKCLLIGAGLFACGSAMNLLFNNNVAINNISSTIIYFAFGLFCFEIKPLITAFYAILLVVLNFSFEIVTVLVIAPYTGQQSIDVNSNAALLVLVVLTSKTLFFLVCLLLSRLISPQANRIKIPMAFLLYPAALLSCLMLTWRVCLLKESTLRIQKYMVASCLLFFVATIIIFIIYQYQINQSRLQMQMEKEIEHLKTEKTYYKILEQQNENLMVYAHDVKKHLASISSLNSNQEMERYVGQLTEKVKSYSQNCHSGNKLLDVMIHKYSMDCKENGIHFAYDVQQCNLSGLSDNDLVSVLGNLMDNAVQAACSSAKKEVVLETTRRNGYSVIILCNSCDAPPKSKGETLLTTKTDTFTHGYGLKSVRKTLKGYDGDFSWEYDEKHQLFTVTVMIGSNKER